MALLQLLHRVLQAGLLTLRLNQLPFQLRVEECKLSTWRFGVARMEVWSGWDEG